MGKGKSTSLAVKTFSLPKIKSLLQTMKKGCKNLLESVRQLKIGITICYPYNEN